MKDTLSVYYMYVQVSKIIVLMKGERITFSNVFFSSNETGNTHFAQCAYLPNLMVLLVMCGMSTLLRH